MYLCAGAFVNSKHNKPSAL